VPRTWPPCPPAKHVPALWKDSSPEGNECAARPIPWPRKVPDCCPGVAPTGPSEKAIRQTGPLVSAREQSETAQHRETRVFHPTPLWPTSGTAPARCRSCLFRIRTGQQMRMPGRGVGGSREGVQTPLRPRRNGPDLTAKFLTTTILRTKAAAASFPHDTSGSLPARGLASGRHRPAWQSSRIGLESWQRMRPLRS